MCVFCIIEEEQKRLQQKSNEFQYSYEGGEKSGGNTEEGPQLNEQVSSVEEKPFTPPIELDVPADIAIVIIKCDFCFEKCSVCFFLAKNDKRKCKD